MNQPIASFIWDAKYRLKTEGGEPVDLSVQDTWLRIANALAEAEAETVRKAQRDDFFWALEDYKFLTAGRITAGAGTGRAVTLSNCFTMGTIPDSIDGIFNALREAALTMQQGGGIGYDFSTIRPKGTLVKGVAADASGPLSFMDVWNAMCKTIMSAGSRRGAMMATMRCDHPDIEDFITAKQDPSRLRMFNLSVLITDPFMEAVKAEGSWDLVFGGRVYKTVQALDLWNLIMRSTYAFAEPGVIFIDLVNEAHNLNYLETIATTNPCGEKPMGPYASCLLGSINMVKFVKKPFTPDASVDLDLLDEVVAVAIRMMDNVIEVGGFPLEEQLRKAREDRQLGLGITGLADALMMLGIKYGSDEALSVTDNIMERITIKAYWASIELAKEKGSFPTLNKDAFLESGFMKGMPSAIRTAIRKHGIRNSLLISIAPTGTISLYAGNVSSGIEPVFAATYTRKVLQKDGSRIEEEVVDYAVKIWRDLKGDDSLPPAYIDAQTLTPLAHVAMQAAAQRWVDSSISKTINCPEDISFEDFQNVYLTAYHLGCKGCTTYRPNDITGSVISVKPAETKPEPQAEPEVQEAPVIELVPRAAALAGKTYKVKWPGSEHALYITINDLDGKPYEVFINSKNIEHFAWTVALTRMISAVYRRGGDTAFVAEELQSVFDPQGGAWMEGRYVPSILAAIGNVIQGHSRGVGVEPTLAPPSVERNIGMSSALALPYGTSLKQAPKDVCPKCFSDNFVNQSGCMNCMDCGHSKCA